MIYFRLQRLSWSLFYPQMIESKMINQIKHNAYWGIYNTHWKVNGKLIAMLYLVAPLSMWCLKVSWHAESLKSQIGPHKAPCYLHSCTGWRIEMWTDSIPSPALDRWVWTEAKASVWGRGLKAHPSAIKQKFKSIELSLLVLFTCNYAHGSWPSLIWMT